MRSCFALFGLLAVSGCGLLQHEKTCGWSFQILNPPTVSTSAIVTQGAAPIGVAGLAAYPAGPAPRPMLAAQLPGPCDPCAPPSSAGPVLAANSPCSLDEVCRKLDQLQRSLPAATPTLPRPMPMGPAQP